MGLNGVSFDVIKGINDINNVTLHKVGCIKVDDHWVRKYDNDGYVVTKVIA